MDTHADTTLARRASPYGLAVLPEKEVYEYTDPRNEAAIDRRWRPICERHGAAVLGIREVPTSPVRVELDGIPWRLEPLGTTERAVPAEVFHRWRALEAEGVPFLYWLWGEEQPQRPNLRPLPASGAAKLGAGLVQSARRLLTWSGDMVGFLSDPVVIGVIPTAPGRGLWVLLGRWFH